MKGKRKHLPGVLLAAILIAVTANSLPVYAYASDGEEYITISVEAEDDNGTLLYALDTDDPGAFGPSNEFSVPVGTDHVIYVKDAAGNITSQEFKSSSSDYDVAYPQGEDDEGRQVNIDVVLDDNPVPDYSDYEYAGDSLLDPAELGQGTVYEQIETNANDNDAQRIFYTVTTDEGEVFYLVIDQGQSSNNVYLLDQVNLSDLHALAVNDQSSSPSEESESLLSSLSQSEEAESDLLEEDSKPKSSGSGNNKFTIIILILCAIGGGAYYYFKIYKDKKDEQMDLVDAFDRDDFAVEEDDEDEDADFGLDEDYQEQTMAMLLSDDDEYMQSLAYENDEIIQEEDQVDMIMAEQQANTASYLTADDEKENTEKEEAKYATSHISELQPEESDPDEEYDEDLDAPDEDEEDEE